MAKKRQPVVEEELTDEEREEEEREAALTKGRVVYNVFHDHGMVSGDGSSPSATHVYIVNWDYRTSFVDDLLGYSV